MQAQQINTVYLEPIPALYTLPEPTSRQLNEFVYWVKQSGSMSALEAYMVFESFVVDTAIRLGKVLVRGDYLVPAGEPRAEAPAATTKLIDEQIAAGKVSNDPAYRINAQMLQDCTQGDWLDQLVVEIKQEEKEEIVDRLEVPGMRLKNLDRPNDTYWLFTGTRQAAIAAVGWLKDLGIASTAKPNGQTGNYKLIVPRYAIGQLIPGLQSQWQEAA